MTGLEYDLWAYDMDLLDACEDVWRYLDHYGCIRTWVLEDIADWYGVAVEDIREEMELH